MPRLTLGPVLYNWPAEDWRDFYFKIADEAPVDIVFLGEVICAKRAPLFDPFLEAVVTRLEAAGKQLVFSTLAEVTSAIDRRLIKRVACSEGMMIEANDASALLYLEDREHTIGPHINVYNEDALEIFAGGGASSFCLQPEIPASGIALLASKAAELGVELEVQVFGRISLALSARCYHARAHDRIKDTCQFICDRDPDGMVLESLDGKPFLTINGIQTQSHTYLNLINELDELVAFGVNRFRISPQNNDTVAVCNAFHGFLEGGLDLADAGDRLRASVQDVPFSNGFYHQEAGFEWHDLG